MSQRDDLLRLLEEVHDVQKIANNLNKWSWLDIFSDSFFLGLVKRNKIKTLNEALSQLHVTVMAVRGAYPELFLNDVVEVPDRQRDFIWDTVFDNGITDIRVHGEIKKVRKSLERMEEEVQQALGRL